MSLKERLAVYAIAALSALPVGGQSYPPTDFTNLGAVQPGDVVVAYRYPSIPRAGIVSMSAIRQGVSPLTTTVSCLGVDDTAAINAAVTTAQAAAISTGGGGAVLHLSGNCVYSGAGITNNPVSGLTQHLVIEGDGVTGTFLTFVACSNPQCIYLGAQSLVGSGHNDGSGLRDLTIVGPAAKDTVVLANLENFFVDHVYIYGGLTALTVSESRTGTVSDVTLRAPAANGIKIVGESYAANFFSNISIVAPSLASGSGVVYARSGTADAGGVQFSMVTVNGSFSGAGFNFTNATASNVFIRMYGCTADGTFTLASFRFVNILNADMVDPFGVNHYASAAAPALLIDDGSDITITSGTLYAQNGADASLKNSVAKTALLGQRFTGSTRAIQVDGTTHDVVVRPNLLVSGVLTNDATKISPSTSAAYTTAPFLLTGTTTSTMLGMIQPGSATAIYTRANSSGDLENVANDASTVLHKVAAGGGETVNQVTNGGIVFSSTRATDTSPTGHFALFKNAAGATLWDVDITGSLAAGTIPVARVTGLAAVATSGSAADLSAGTLSAARLPNPSASTLGGVQSKAAVASNWLTSISTSGVPAASQPAFTDISGTATDAQVPDDVTVTSTHDIATAGKLTLATTAATPSGLPTFTLAEGSSISVVAPSGLSFQRFMVYQAGSLNSSSSHIFYTQNDGASAATAKLRISESGHLVTSSPGTPAVSCTGTGTSPSAPTIRGTDVDFIITMNTGTGSPGSTGTCTVTFTQGFTSTANSGIVPVVVCMPVKGATAWGNGATLQLTTESATAPVVTWTNLVGGAATALTVSTSYKLACHVLGLES